MCSEKGSFFAAKAYMHGQMEKIKVIFSTWSDKNQKTSKKFAKPLDKKAESGTIIALRLALDAFKC